MMRLFKKDPHEPAARAIYSAVVTQARQPRFYSDLGVPDSLDGRFELIVLHTFLVLRRLKGRPGAGANLAQALFDVLFRDMDQSLREMGVGDVGVSHRIKAMVEGFYGRVAAYDAGIEDGPGSLEQALARNLYGTVDASDAQLRIVADYLRREAAALAEQDLAAALEGRIAFGGAPAGDAEPDGRTADGA